MLVNKILHGNVLDVVDEIPDNYVHTIITSPPYWALRDYGRDGQLGMEDTPEEYVNNIVTVFGKLYRVLRDDGTLWLNLGDTYMSGGGAFRHLGYTDPKYKNGRKVVRAEPQANKHNVLKPKDLVGIPWRVALALQAYGWYLRSDIIWNKPNAMPESVKDRPTRSHEHIFLLSKNSKYYYDYKEILEYAKTSPVARDKSIEAYNQSYTGGRFSSGKRVFGYGNKRNSRDVWSVNTKPYKESHFAVFPEEIAEKCLLAGCPKNGIVLDPFMGSGTVAAVALMHGRKYIGIEINDEYIEFAKKRIGSVNLSFLGLI